MSEHKEREHKRLLKKFHTLCGVVGINSEHKEVILEGCGVTSSKDLSNEQLMQLCNELDRLTDPKQEELNRWRKRLIVAISSYFKAMNYDANIDKIKATACRAAQTEYFNKIPLDKLRSLYNAFKYRAKDLNATKVTFATDISIINEEYLN